VSDYTQHGEQTSWT